MKTILLFTILMSLGAVAAEVEGPDPENKTIPEEIHDIAMLAATVENRLRDDNCSKPVQLDSKEVIDRIEKLIKDAEEAPQGAPKNDRDRDLQRIRGDRSPMRDSHKSGVDRATDDKEHPYDDGTRDSWASLPKSQRGEIVQTYAREIPLLWRKRIEAYLLSINAEESKEIKKRSKYKEKY